MNFLLDSRILIAVVERRTGNLPSAIKDILDDSEHGFFTSVASLWEITIKWRLGKLTARPPPQDLPALLRKMGIGMLTVQDDHVLALVEPEPPTRDPFDRLLLAQCQVENMLLVTMDRALSGHRLSALAG